jgi:hypothetical protein
MSKRTLAAIAATMAATAVMTVSAGLALSQPAAAQEVKVGLILPYTGVGAELAQQMDRGIEQYLKLNAAAVKPYSITIIKRDSKAPDGAAAKVDAQELLTQDKGLFTRRHRIGAGRQCRQEARGDHERRYVVHHQPVALLRPHLLHAVAVELRHGRAGGEIPARQDRGGRLYRLSARQGCAGRVQIRLRA